MGTGRRGVVLIAFVLVACTPGAAMTQSPDASATASTAAVESPRPTVSPSPSARPYEYEDVEFAADGGPTLRGRVWSDGRIGVILAHGHSLETGQDDWSPFADHLAGLGYGVLTFDFRGFCDLTGCSEPPRQLGENWRDVAAAVEYLRSRGSERIFLVGASMGGIAAFRAADEAELELAGIVSLATPQFGSIYYAHMGEPAANDVTPERLQRIAGPKLFIAGRSDSQGPFELAAPDMPAVLFAEEARSMFDASSEPKQLEIVDSGFHSSQLVAGAGREVEDHTRALIVAFLEQHA